MDERELDNRFDYHRPDDNRARAHDQVRQSAKLLANTINALVPDSDEKDAAIHKLEETMFWANAAIARQPVTVEEVTIMSGLVPVRTEFGTVLGEPLEDHGTTGARYSPPSSLFGSPDDGHRRDA